MRKLRKMKLMEVYALAIFVIFLILAIVFAVVSPNRKVFGDITMVNISVVLIFLDFPVALIAAIFASLSIREEEEEKTAV